METDVHQVDSSIVYESSSGLTLIEVAQDIREFASFFLMLQFKFCIYLVIF